MKQRKNKKLITAILSLAISTSALLIPLSASADAIVIRPDEGGFCKGTMNFPMEDGELYDPSQPEHVGSMISIVPDEDEYLEPGATYRFELVQYPDIDILPLGKYISIENENGLEDWGYWSNPDTNNTRYSDITLPNVEGMKITELMGYVEPMSHSGNFDPNDLDQRYNGITYIFSAYRKYAIDRTSTPFQVDSLPVLQEVGLNISSK